MFTVQGIDVTPNPNAMKFILNEHLLSRETRNYKSAEEAAKDPFAKGIFDLNGVVSVFYMDKFVTVEKTPDAGWGELQKEFAQYISKIDKSSVPEESEPVNVDDINATELLKAINTTLDQRVRPALAADGGGLEVVNLDGLTLSIRYQGACGSCPSAIRGTLVAIENLLKREVNPDLEVIPG